LSFPHTTYNEDLAVTLADAVVGPQSPDPSADDPVFDTADATASHCKIATSTLVRKRAPAIADAIGHQMREAGARVQITHHHINQPPVPRKHPRPDCPFCAIIHNGAPATIVHEWADALAIKPRSGGCTDGHLLVLPRGHVADFTTDPVVSATVQLRAAELAQELGGQWNYLTSCGPDATQTVFHLHGHLVPRTAGDTLALPWTRLTREQEPTR
jgi:diadenosine tetraphosphate (Ap4A) HIT family hydrolase